jgi:PHP family Zn ribbon phosphoesterase
MEKRRVGEFEIKPGFDGEYGKVEIFNKEKKENKQSELF